jgi:uncharacterized protein (TIGR02285 family)
MRYSAILYFLFFSVFSECIYAEEKPTIRWLTWEQAPNFIIEGKFKGQGVAGTLTKTLQDNLPQYNHINVLSNTRRYQSLIKEKDVCVAWAWIVPGSEKFRIYSRAVSLAPRTGIQTLKSKQHLFGKIGTILSLEKLLTKLDLKLGYLEDMTYSKRVHELLEKNRSKGNIHFSSIDAVEFNLPMLDRGHLDYFFGFSAQAIFDAASKDIQNKYQFYNIEEMDPYTSMYSHCSKTPFGKKVMSELDKVLTNDVLMEHLSVVERWYGENEAYRNVFIKYVINSEETAEVTNPGQ